MQFALTLLVLAPVVTSSSIASAGTFMLEDGFSEKPGHVWGEASYIYWNADKKFAGPSRRNRTQSIELGDPVSFTPTGEATAVSKGYFVNLAAVPFPRTELRVNFAPRQTVIYAPDNSDQIATTGPSDVWTSAAYELTEPGGKVGTKLGIQAKFPMTELPTSDLDVALGSGQLDIAVEQATTWAPSSALHLTFRTVFRHRFPYRRDGQRLKPGDETQIGFEVGGAPLRSIWKAPPVNIWTKLGYRGLWGLPTQQRSGKGAIGLKDPRQLHEISGGIYITDWASTVHPELETLALDVWYSEAVAGQTLPTGQTFKIGLAWSTRIHGSASER